MLQQIMNMLWNSRRHNLWIMLELVVITIVSWAVLDPLFVLTYNQSIPNGYDAEGLYRLEVTRNKADTLSVPAGTLNGLCRDCAITRTLSQLHVCCPEPIPVLRVII